MAEKAKKSQLKVEEEKRRDAKEIYKEGRYIIKTINSHNSKREKEIRGKVAEMKEKNCRLVERKALEQERILKKMQLKKIKTEERLKKEDERQLEILGSMEMELIRKFLKSQDERKAEIEKLRSKYESNSQRVGTSCSKLTESKKKTNL